MIDLLLLLLRLLRTPVAAAWTALTGTQSESMTTATATRCAGCGDRGAPLYLDNRGRALCQTCLELLEPEDRPKYTVSVFRNVT